MKVISQQKVNDWNCKVTCHHCDSELLVESGDLRCTVYDQDPRERYSEEYSAICVVCNHKLPIPQEKLPKIVKILAKNKTNSGSYFDK